MKQKADVLIVGTGVAGLFCALQIPEKYDVCIVTKEELEGGDSFLAQGGISTLKDEDDYDSYFDDTMKAGHYENNPEAVDMMIRESTQIIDALCSYGVEFAKEGDELSYAREGAHSVSRVLYHEDTTGKEITSKLLERVEERENITLFPNTCMIDILKDETGCHGAVMRCEDGRVDVIQSKIVVWATGGIGGLFESSTNYSHMTGDALAIALLHDVKLKNINYIQIHPTTLYTGEKGRRFLISEAVRGEGAHLLNAAGERFTDELLPRDLLTNEIKKQMKKDGKDFVWLSITHLDPEQVKSRFPNIYRQCLKAGYDLTKEAIPVTPAQHYSMGGVEIDMNGKTSLANLYTIGEAACNGVHGRNRLASNSLLESLVFAKCAAETMTDELKQIPFVHIDADLNQYRDAKELEKQYRRIILDEIKREDEAFYDQWCNTED